MELDEENDEYIADFASFALECRRVPQAVKEFQRYSRRLEMADIPTDDVLYMAARNIVDTIEVIDPEKANPMVQPWVKQALRTRGRLNANNVPLLSLRQQRFQLSCALNELSSPALPEHPTLSSTGKDLPP